jgi:5'-nucleotidase
MSLAGAVAIAGPSQADPKPDRVTKAKTTQIQILGLNDFHGFLEAAPANASSGNRIGRTTDVDPDPTKTNFQCLPPTCVPAGGVEYLATHVDRLRATNPNTLFVSAGDLIGATPLTSAAFHDEPSIEAFNLMGLDYNGVGNHEFDEGVDELLRMQNGGCHPVDGCQDGDGFAGADFDFLAANVKYKATGEPIFAPYKVHEFPGVDVAIVGMTTKSTPSIVTPAGIASVDFLDEAESVNNLIPELKAQGIETIIVLLHEGGSTSTSGNGTGGPDVHNDVDKCVNPTGVVPGVVEAMSDEVDVVVTGHTNWAVNCVIDGKVVTGAGSNGRLVTDIDLTINRATKEVIPDLTRVNNEVVTRDVDKDAAQTANLEKYLSLVAPIANQVVGSTTAAITRTSNFAGESALGDVIADAQLAATATSTGAQVAFMNPGGIRSDLDAGTATYGELFAVQPFSNVVTTVTCTGAQIEAILEQQWQPNGTTVNILQVSNGFTYAYDRTRAIGDRVDPASIALNGTTLDPAAPYRVTTNNFVVTGGDGFSTFLGCTNQQVGQDDLVVLVDYFGSNSPVAPGPQNRITRLG